MVARFNLNNFAVAVHYQDPDNFNPELFERLVHSIRRHTMQSTDQDRQFAFSIGIWHGHDLDPTPAVAEIIGYANQARRQL